MTEATAEMMSEWLNQVLQEMCNDPVIVELWSAMKMGNQSCGKAGRSLSGIGARENRCG